MLNLVALMGRLTDEPELRHTTNGTPVVSFTLAVERRFKTGEERTADFINIVAWRQTAEFIAKFFRKGRPICIVGSIQSRNYTDQQGNKRYVTEVVADEASFVDSKQDNQNTTPAFAGMGDYGSAPAYSAPAAAPAAQPAAPKFEEIAGDEDLPF